MVTVKEKILNKIKQVPQLPGCYFWKDYTGTIIYIGKAKNLPMRLKQYLSSDVDHKTKKMISNAIDFDFVITKNEAESLVTESNLINKYKPKYNILFREQANYNYLIITNEVHPRILMTRNFNHLKVKFKFGPITDDSYKRRKLMEIINRFYKFRKCKRIPKAKCIYYDLNQCYGPCIEKVDTNIYQPLIDDLSDLFKGKSTQLLKDLILQEKSYATNLEFEKAKDIFDVINLIKEIPDLINIARNEFDVLGFYSKDDIITMSIFSYEDNKLISKFCQTIFIKMGEIQQLLEQFIYEYYHNQEYNNKKLITSIDINPDVTKLLKIDLIQAINNQYVDVVKLAIANSLSVWKIESLKLNVKYNRLENALEDLKKIIAADDLSLIEIYDNSHLFNKEPIGVKVSYVNGDKRTNLYRKFNIKEFENKSDYHYMYEVISRRIKSIYKNTNESIPNLIIVDGGLIQINAAIKALQEHNLLSIIKLIGLVKDKNHKTNEIIFTNGTKMLLDKKSDLFFFLSNMQDEVHRFAISTFRKKQNKNFYDHELNKIDGIGEKTIKKLFTYFETVDDIKSAKLIELQQLIGSKMANKVYEYFHQKN